ncbi:MAG: hypothetical protein QOF57_2194 [Frankiaceae bacterium]|jgi:hypothetical protein|nr:hypothetical protein [Frankiaceae bacterium]
MDATEIKPLERHNASADEHVIAAGACGQKHLPTGRTCIRAARHTGTCEFRSPDEVQAVAEGLTAPLPG